MVASARAGDREAYAELIRLHYQRVFLTCLEVLGNQLDAEDMVQAVFVKGMSQFDVYKRIRKPIMNRGPPRSQPLFFFWKSCRYSRVRAKFSMGIFSAFLDEPEVILYGVEPLGKGEKTGDHAATLTDGKPGVIHGFKCYLLQDGEGEPSPVYSIASGLDYPGVGPEHSMFFDQKKAHYETASDKECLDAFFALSRKEGIIPALESAHALAYALKLAKEKPRQSILVNLSGRGDKDIDFVTENYGCGDSR